MLLTWQTPAWLAPFVAFGVCWICLALLMRFGARLPLDRPNERSLHVRPTPRIGGIGIVAGLSAAALLLDVPAVTPFLIGALILAAVSLFDDFKNLPAALRLLVHVGVAFGCVFALPELNAMAHLAAVLGIVWMTNLYNFMDGADGLAGGMATIGFGALALAAWLAGATGFALLCAAIAAAALAFLRFNFPPARLFMGDIGSIPLGFLAALLALYGMQQDYWPLRFPLLVFSPFIVDASVTLLRRAGRREKIWQAHREHYYQRAVLLGASHRQLAFGAYALMLTAAALGFVSRAYPSYGVAVAILSVALYLVLFRVIDRRWQHAQA